MLLTNVDNLNRPHSVTAAPVPRQEPQQTQAMKRSSSNGDFRASTVSFIFTYVYE